MAVLPYLQTADVLAQGGTVVKFGIAVSIWPAGDPVTAATAESYEFTGEAELDAADALVGQGNRSLRVDGRRYKVLAAHRHEFLPHVELRLREMRPAG